MAVMWATMSIPALGQLTALPTASQTGIAASSTTAAAAATTTTSSKPTNTATLSFSSIPTLTACQTQTLSWDFTGNDVSEYDFSLYVLGTTGNSSTSASAAAPASSTASTARAVAREVLVDLRKRDDYSGTIMTQSAAATSYPFLVDLPFGKYYLHGRVSDSQKTAGNSNLFWVVEGSDMSCLNSNGTAASSSSASTAPTSKTSSARGSGTAAAGNAVSTDSKSGISSGAIAGIAIAAVAGLVAVGLVLYFCCYRKRSRRVEIGQPEMVSRGETAFGSQFAAAAAMTGRPTHVDDRNGNGHTRQGHMELTSMGDSADSHERDEGPFAGSYGSEGHDLSPSSRANPFATSPNTPMDGEDAVFPDVFAVGATREERRVSQPLTSPKQTHERSRSNSQPSSGPSGKAAKTIKRVPSARRKPVPSLGPELRTQLKHETSQKQLREGDRRRDEQSIPLPKADVRQSFQLMPDPPRGPQ